MRQKSGFHLWKDKNLNSNKKIMLAIYVKNKNAKKNHLLRGNEKKKNYENENFSQKKWI
jgi:hypothetical protein